MFTERDLKNSWDESEAQTITLKGSTAETSAKNVSLSDGVLTIGAEGIYVLSGSFEGQIVVDAGDSDKIQLVLDGAEISCENSAAIYVKSADKLFVTTAPDSENTLCTTGAFQADGETNVDGVIFAKCDLTLNGTGTLNISTQNGHGVVSKDDLVIAGGIYNITASGHGISGKDSVRAADGEINVTSGNDSIHSENTEDTSKGFVYIASGKFTLDAQGDGIDSSLIVQIEGGEIDIKTSGTSSDVSSKGIKADQSIIVNDGKLSIDSTDDGIHCTQNIEINGGELTISSGDDGIHSDNNLSINGSTLKITDNYEGLEGLTIDITDGDITVVSSDDGLNAAGGNDQSGFGGMGGGRGQENFESSSDAYIRISGGKLTVDADGDGVDSNGALYVSGGETYVSGPTNSANGALDYGSTAEITGGTFVAVGASGMATGFTTGTQGAILTNVSNGSQQVSLKDSDGNVLVSFEPDKSYSSVVVSCPGIEQGKTYTLTANGSDTTIEMTSLIYSAGGGFGGGNMGGNMGGRGGMENFDPNTQMSQDGMQLPDENMTLPDGEVPQMPDGNFQQGQMTPPDMGNLQADADTENSDA